MDIGLDFVRDWQWCLGVWILSGFLGVFFSNLFSRASGKTVAWECDILVFLIGPIWWIACLGNSLGAFLHDFSR